MPRCTFGSGCQPSIRAWMTLWLLGVSLGFSIHAEILVPRFALWHYLKGTNEASPGVPGAWRERTFDDSAWPMGPLPVYYGEPLKGTEVPDMRGLYSSIYFRTRFTIEHPAEVLDLTLHAVSDDGFIAWINGHEVARFNVPDGELGHDATAITTFTEPLPFDAYSIALPGSVLVAGENVIAVHGFNASLSGSSDFVFDPLLEFTRDMAVPMVDVAIPANGAIVPSLESFEVLFSRPVDGVDASDLLINGTPASGVTEFGPGQFVFTFPALSAGPVTLTFRTNHGITDRAVIPHAFAGGSWTVTIDPRAQSPGVLLNEFLADNKRGLRDVDGDRSDWLELLNPGATTVYLAGWTLTDDPNLPGKWKIPGVVLKPNDYLLIFASKKNRADPAAELHANFRLAKESGSFLGLYDTTGTLISGFTNYPTQVTDVSYGRVPGSPQRTGYFPTPTPGNVNSTAGDGFSPEVAFSETSRTYLDRLSVALSTIPPGADIRFTTDGSVPTETSPAYTAPLLITNTLQIRARAFAPGLFPGPLHSETFIPIANPVAAFSTDLPVLIIHDFNHGRPPANENTFAAVQLYEPGTNGLTSLTNAPTLTSRAWIAARGSSTEGYPKVSLKLKLQDELGYPLDEPILGMPAESDWVLYAPNNFEPIMIHNPLAHQMARDFGRYSPRTRFVVVYLVQSGTNTVAQSSYNGIYVLEEKIKLGKQRVDAPSLNPGQNKLPVVSGGYLMKVDRPDPGDSGYWTGNQQALYVDPKESELRLPERAGQLQYINQYLSAFDAALYGPNSRNPTNGFRAYVDLGAAIDHHLLNVLTFNVDALRLSAFFYKPRDGKLTFGPLWDFDRTLYSTDGRDSNPRTWRSAVPDYGTDFFNQPWWGPMFSDPDFYQDYIDRYQEKRRSVFATTNLWRLVDLFANQVRREQPREQARWGVVPRGGFQGEINSLKSWLSNRVDFMDSQFVPPPSISGPDPAVPPVRTLSIRVPSNTTVYYTLDGTDPRASGSSDGSTAAPGAKIYSGPVPLKSNARVVARARNPNHVARTGLNNPPLKSIWSGPVAATWVVRPLTLQLTEIMFHPAADEANNSAPANDFEFLELRNFGSEPQGLVNCSLSGAVQFTFAKTNSISELAPGARLILAKRRDAFLKRYPGVTNLAGEYSGSLADAGDRIILTGPLLEPVFDVRYLPDWFPDTDGKGHSLVPVEENQVGADGSLMGTWRVSTEDGGSPGRIDPTPSIPTPVTIVPTGNSTVELRFKGVPGALYRVEEADRLGADAWKTVSTPSAAPDGTVVLIRPIGATPRFFRVVVP
jgi:CotH kinase protein/Chitobiase/beta-hexosaminidase C-terminal domain/Lamin Tail Domain/Fn3 associated